MASSAFRPDPNRAVFITGVIEEALFDQLLPQLVKFKSVGDKPLTVYIQSHGGRTDVADRLIQFIRSPAQGSAQLTGVITVAPAFASSAAAHLLSEGDYAIAYAQAELLYHGVRQIDLGPVTTEKAASLADDLNVFNESRSLRLARRAIGRILFLRSLLQTELRKALGEHSGEEVQVFGELIRARVGRAAAEVVATAMEKNAQAGVLLLLVEPHLKKKSVRDALVAIIDHEFSTPPARVSELTGRVHRDVLVLDDWLAPDHPKLVERIAERFKGTILTPEDLQRLGTIPEPDRRQAERQRACEYIAPYWFLAVAICRALHHGDNALSAEDAYWLGLIDEVSGREDLVSIRQLHEAQLEQESRANGAGN